MFFVWGGADDYEVSGSSSVAASNIIEIVKTLQAEGHSTLLYQIYLILA